ncbi:Probable transcriptional regulator, TetR [Mycobacteroides abscessus subsp. abscessus]|nr:Probable transcriptional regulator, TetR [Mycobacteroides abscessus subsp. abscessus]
MSTEESSLGRGRRRSSDIDVKALAAARELLVEQGWEATTMVMCLQRDLATQSGTHSGYHHRFSGKKSCHRLPLCL